MMLLKIVPKDGPVFIKQDAKEILEECIKQEYETVIVFGFKDGLVHSRHSASVDTLKLIGALTVARDEFWERR